MLAHLVVVKYHDLPTLAFFAIGTVLWVVAASYETQYLFRTRAFQFKVAYWQGYCPYCDHFHEDYQFAFEPRPYEFYKLVICKCERDLVVKTDIDGYHHLA